MKAELPDVSKTEAKRVANGHREAIIIDTSYATRSTEYAERNYPPMMKDSASQEEALYRRLGAHGK